MAKAANGNKRRKIAPTRMPVSIQPDPKPDTPSYYVNWASVGRTEFDFILTVLRVPSQLTPEQAQLATKNLPVPVEPLLQLILPPRLIDGLIQALTEQRNKYEKDFGPIKTETNVAG